MEPEGSEVAESEASESGREVEVETDEIEEEPDVEEIKADKDVATEEYEDVVQEAAEEEPAESSKGQGKGSINRKPDRRYTCRDYRQCWDDNEFVVSHAQPAGQIAQFEPGQRRQQTKDRRPTCSIGREGCD